VADLDRALPRPVAPHHSELKAGSLDPVENGPATQSARRARIGALQAGFGDPVGLLQVAGAVIRPQKIREGRHA